MTAANGPVFERLLRNSGWLLGANGVTAACGITQGIIVTRLLGVEGYGMLAIVIAFVTVMRQLTSFRMNEFVVKYVSDALASEREDQASAAVKVAMIAEALASLVAFGVVWAAAPLGARWFAGSVEAIPLIRLYAIVVLTTFVTETGIGLLHVFNRFRAQSVILSLEQGTLLLCVVIATLTNGTIASILLAYLLARAAGSVMIASVSLRETTQRLGVRWWRVPLRKMEHPRAALHFALHTNVSSSLSLMMKEGDPLWLGYFRGTAEAGFFRLALSLTRASMMPVTLMVQAIYPEATRLAAGERWQEFRALLKKSSLFAAAYVIPAAALFIAFARPLIGSIYGPDFEPAVPAVVILLVGVGFANIFYWSRLGLLSMHRADYVTKLNVGLAALKAGGVLLLVPASGYLGSAALLSFVYLIGVWLSIRKVFLETRRRIAPEYALC